MYSLLREGDLSLRKLFGRANRDRFARKRIFRHFVWKIISLFTPIVSFVLRMLVRSWRYNIVGGAEMAERTLAGEPVIVSLWHGQLLPLTCSIFHLEDKRVATMASDSYDGAFITDILQRWGFAVANGSSRRGGAKAVVLAKRLIDSGHWFAITVDGPVGPRHIVKQGIVYMAKKTNATVWTGVCRCGNAVQFKSWDKFVLPLPFSKIDVHFSECCKLNTDTSVEALERDRLLIEKRMLEEYDRVSNDVLSKNHI
ncbi:lysophospholipid acyltransferase family protein [Deferribacterales bacterium RsTz2092]|nr:hypothetical protein AGMMS49941_07820 [Deferribacterales bacterium]